ncbi:MAG: hypothetical protein V1707_02830 [bacterium]
MKRIIFLTILFLLSSCSDKKDITKANGDGGDEPIIPNGTTVSRVVSGDNWNFSITGPMSSQANKFYVWIDGPWDGSAPGPNFKEGLNKWEWYVELSANSNGQTFSIYSSVASSHYNIQTPTGWINVWGFKTGNSYSNSLVGLIARTDEETSGKGGFYPQ